MSIRPGQAKGPYVGSDAGGGGAPVNASYVTVTDESASLPNSRELAVSGNLALGDGGPGNQIAITGPAYANVGAGAGQIYRGVTAPTTVDLKTIKAGTNVTVTNNADDITISATAATVDGNVPSFHDEFKVAKPMWPQTQAITSGDFQVNLGTNKLEGLAQNNQYDWIRRGIEGDVDFIVKVERGSASSVGPYLVGNSNVATIKRTSTGLYIECTGEGNITPAGGADTMWLRILWTVDGTIKFYWKILDADAWTLQQTYTGKNFGHDKWEALDSATNGAYLKIFIYDNMGSHQARSHAPNKTVLTDAATIALDASASNFYTVTLGGNRTLGNPTNPLASGQMIMIRVKQDGSGNRTLAYDTKYRFSTALPSPTLSTAAAAQDYLGFVYNENDDKWDFIAFVKGF